MKALFILLLALWLGNVGAQQALEIIPLRARTVDQVLPSLLPLVEPGGALTGMNNQLFLRASPRNREEIKRALAAIDTPPRKLIIRVSSTRGADDTSRGGATSGRIVIGSNTRIESDARVWDSRSQSQESGTQMVQTIEGGRAFIQVGRSLPVPMRQVTIGPEGPVVTNAVIYRDIGQGFYAEPRLAGERVTLDISQHSDTPAPIAYGPGSANTQRLATTISGRLGEWLELGGSGQQGGSSERGSLSVSTRDARDTRSIWLKVDEIP